jgi:N-acetylmuramoyl-L-alanine amidase
MIIRDFLTINEYSRCGKILDKVIALAYHYTGKPQGGKATRDYFEELKNQPPNYLNKPEPTYGSAQFIVNMEGIIYQTMPENEISYHCGSSKIDPKSGKIYTDYARFMFNEYATNPKLSPNLVTIGIELVPIDNDGKFSDATLLSAAYLGADICTRYKLDPIKQVCTHNMIVGYKECPLLWTRKPILFDDFRIEIKNIIGRIA